MFSDRSRFVTAPELRLECSNDRILPCLLIKITAFCSSNEFIGGESTRLIGNLLILSDSIAIAQTLSRSVFRIHIPMKNGRNISGTQIVRDKGLGEYEQRFLISRDDYGAKFIQAPCDDLLKSWRIPKSKTK